MRLIDQVMSASFPYERGSAADTRVSQLRATLEGDLVRYILDIKSSQQCAELLRDAPAMFSPEDPFLRLPGERTWLEFFGDAHDDDASGKRQRFGALIEADASGRRGSIQTFYETRGVPLIDPGLMLIDLDSKADPSNGTRIRHDSLPHIDNLLSHVSLQVDRQLVPQVLDQKSVLRSIAQSTWFTVPIALAFTAMLNSGGILEERKSELQKINRARTKARKRPLLDHVEVSMQLGYNYEHYGSGGHGSRATPRLHYVRGHIVRRAGQTFWRSSHLRGDVSGPMLPKTVNFRGGAR